MINLLTIKDRQANQRDYRERWWVTLLSLLAVLLIVANILLATVGAVVRWDTDSLTSLKANIDDRPEVREFDQLMMMAKQARQALQIVSVPPGSPLTTSLITSLIQAHPAGIKFTGFVIKNIRGRVSTVELAGTATSRAIFLTYLDQLQKDSHFSIVDSPLTNLLQDEPANFVVNLTLASTSPVAN